MGPVIYRDYEELIGWANGIRTMNVRANADRPDQASAAIAFGAEGIGLCRTEHMFFEGERIDWVRRMILAEDETGRKEALSKLLPMQREDFHGIFEAMGDRPVTVRTLDPPLHEFLPHEEKDIAELAGKMGVDAGTLADKVTSLKEANPMLGHRGCRLGIVYPEITEMQARAIFEAAAELGSPVIVATSQSAITYAGYDNIRCMVENMAEATGVPASLHLDHGTDLTVIEQCLEHGWTSIMIDGSHLPFDENIEAGAMIEIPSAAMVADRLAAECDFLSIGTNDLVQYALAVDRGSSYVSSLYRPHDPSVLALIARSVEGAALAGKPIALCGEMAGTPAYVPLLIGLGLRELSVSNGRLPATKKAIRDVDLDTAVSLANEAVAASTAGDVGALLGLDAG